MHRLIRTSWTIHLVSLCIASAEISSLSHQSKHYVLSEQVAIRPGIYPTCHFPNNWCVHNPPHPPPLHLPPLRVPVGNSTSFHLSVLLNSRPNFSHAFFLSSSFAGYYSPKTVPIIAEDDNAERRERERRQWSPERRLPQWESGSSLDRKTGPLVLYHSVHNSLSIRRCSEQQFGRVKTASFWYSW